MVAYKILLLFLSYLLGSVPFGFIFVKLATGKDVTQIQSGRTGGTNAMRAAGLGIGILTAVIDVLKASVTVWAAKALFPDAYIIHAIAPVLAILGHNYSIFLIHRNEAGKLTFRGGAGGAACLGGSLGLWAPSFLIIFPIAVLIYYFIGFASVTTLSVAFFSIVVFAIKSFSGYPIEYILFGILSQLLLIWALRPNIKALIAGNERIHGFRARNKKE